LFPFLNGTKWKCLLLTFSDMVELLGSKFKNETAAELFHWSSWLVDNFEAWTI
jgi:hypothetical protein